MEDAIFRDWQSLVPNIMEEQGSSVTLRESSPLNLGEEDFGGLQGKSDVELLSAGA
ncbi:MAG: hypothetical protein ACRCU6_09245 [Fusobacteriaceae bacterium]